MTGTVAARTIIHITLRLSQFLPSPIGAGQHAISATLKLGFGTHSLSCTEVHDPCSRCYHLKHHYYH
jgi:hypothetical protein